MKYTRIWKRIVCFWLAVILLLVNMPMPILNAAEEQSGTCGTNVTWHFADGTLTISGTGTMTNYNYNSMPWYSLKNDIEAVVIESGVTSIGNYAIYGCYNLKSVTIANTVAEIGTYAFQACRSLQSVTLPASVKNVKNAVFYECSTLETVEIQGSNVTLGNSAFKDCRKLTSIKMDGVTRIEHEAFYGCVSLKEAEIPDGVTYIGGYAFQNCDSLQELKIPDSVKNIDSSAFSSCDGLRTVEFQGGNVILGNYAFSDCKYLTAVKLNGVTSIGERAFMHCYALKTVEFSDSVTAIGSSAFMDCDSLTHITIGNRTTSVGANAFEGCGTLQSVEISESVTSVAGAAFKNGGYLETVLWNAKNCQTIGNDVFLGNGNLNTVIIGDKVDVLSTKLWQVLPTGSNVAFQGPNYFSIVEATKAAGEEEEPPSMLETVLEGGDYYADKNGVVYRLDSENNTASLVYCSPDITSLEIPAQLPKEDGSGTYSVTEVESYALFSAEKLTSITFASPETINQLDALSLANCPTLQSVNGKTTEAEVNALFPNATIAPDVFRNTGITDESAGTLTTDKITVSVDNGPEVTLSTSQVIYTGETSTTKIDISNPDNSVGTYMIRVYFQFSGDGYISNYAPGEYTLVVKQGEEEYPFQVCQSESDAVYYVDFAQPVPGGTSSLNIESHYPSPSSAGGDVLIWAEIWDTETENPGASVTAPETYQQVTWKTQRDTFTVSKTPNSTKPVLVGDGEENGNVYVQGLRYNIQFSRVGDTLEDVGKDYTRSIEYEDILELPEGTKWREGLVEAIRNGQYFFNSGWYATVDGEDYLVASLSSAYVSGYDLAVTDDGDIVVKWIYNNASESKEISLGTTTITYGSQVICVDDQEFSVDSIYTFNNTLTAVQHFTHSEDVIYTPEASAAVSPESEATFTIIKGAYSTYSSKYLGETDAFYVTLKNPGALPYKNLKQLRDPLPDVFYIKPADMQTMFDEDATDANAMLSIQIVNATLCSEVPGDDKIIGTDGKEYGVTNATTGVNTEYSGLKSVDSVTTDYATLTLQWNAEQDGLQLVVERTGATAPEVYAIGTAEIPSIEDALQQLGYLVTRQTQFYPTWTFVDGFTLYGGQKLTYDVLSTIKDSFMYTDADVRHQVMSSSTSQTNYANAYYTDSQGKEKYKTASVSRSIYRDFYLTKGATVGDTTLNADTTLTQGDIITYSLSLQHQGANSYDALPMVDHLQGGQVLLVPAATNAHLATEPYSLTEETFDGSSYYVLDKPGVYKNIVVGSLLADSVTITKNSDGSGLSTLIRWYLTGISGSVTKKESYKALVHPARAGVETVVYSVNNEVWAGDHQSHRLWDTVGGYATRLSFDKSIVTNLGEATPADDSLAEFSVMYEGESITYRFTLRNISDGRMTVTGANIYDILPASVNSFWDKDDITEIRYVAADGSSLQVVNGDSWYVAEQGPDGSNALNRQYLCWSDDFSMDIDTVAYIYVILKCPEGEEWKSYTNQYSGTRLQNDLVVYSLQDTVYHDLAVDVEAVLQKGVYMTGIKRDTGNGYYTGNKDTESRFYYANDDTYIQLVLYYVTLYNGGNGRLYLNDLQDVLPKGFTFFALIDSTYWSTTTQSYMYAKWSAKTLGGSAFASLTDPEDTVAWKDGTVSAKTAMLPSGEQKVTFSVVDYASSSSNDLLYDEMLGKYYLEPGAGIKFCYACRTNKQQATEDVAVNQVAMPYYDYTGAGIRVSDNVTIQGQDMGDIRRNDGDCQLLSDAEAESIGFTDGETETMWLSSDVTVRRGQDLVPGITKKVLNQSAYAQPLDTVNWELIVTSTGNCALTDYTITDVMEKPYQITDSVSYTIYRDVGLPSGFYAEMKLFTVVSRTDTTLTVQDYNNKQYTLPLDGTAVNLSVKLTFYGGGSSSTNSSINVSVKSDENGNEVLSLHFPEDCMSLPAHGYGVLSVSTKNETNAFQNTVYYNTAYITPQTQTFDPEMVMQGNNTTWEGKPAVRSSAFITVSAGYITSSEKKVEQVSNPDNTASGNNTVNYIILSDETDLFRFTLQVNNITDQNMEKLILIDGLPEPGDHSAFETIDLRFSEFKVSLAELPDFAVTVTDTSGNVTILDASQYSLGFSSKTVFEAGDWNGTSEWSATSDAQTRSFRVVITDTTGTVVPAGSVVRVAFTAKIDGEANPGDVAWNNFGYHYKMLGDSTEMEAAPLKVGVRLPEIPEIEKELTLEDGTPFAAEKDETFRFLIYKGSALTLPDGYTEAELAQMLKDAAREFTYVALPVKKGQSVSETVLLEDRVCYTYEDGVWIATETAWNWTKGITYTVMELPLAGEDFVQGTIGGLAVDSYSFTYNPVQKKVIPCVNYRNSWEILLHKTDKETGEALAGAFFGLYSPEEADKLSDEAYAALTTQLGFGLRKTVKVDGKTYYLIDVKMSDVQGKIHWTGLIRNTAYSVCELKAPKGYFISVDPQLVQFVDYDTTVEITVPNASYYELPSSAGEGIFGYTIGGVLLLGLGVLLVFMKLRKQPS